MNAIREDDRTRTPPHGDPLRPNEAELDQRIREVAVAISRRTPVRPFEIYEALLHHSAEEVEAAIAEAVKAGVDPSSFQVYLTEPALGAATRRAMAGPEIPHNEAGVPIMAGVTVIDAMNSAPTFDVSPRPLSSHLERAARKAYAAGHRDGTTCNLEHGKRVGCSDDRGVEAFRESLRAEPAKEEEEI